MTLKTDLVSITRLAEIFGEVEVSRSAFLDFLEFENNRKKLEVAMVAPEEYATIKEFANMFGVKLGTAHMWTIRYPDFPKPFVKGKLGHGAGHCFKISEVVEWHKKWVSKNPNHYTRKK